MSLVWTGMGVWASLTLRSDWLSGRTSVHSGTILRAARPFSFATQMIVMAGANVITLGVGLWVLWFTVRPPVEVRARRLARRRARR